MAVLDQFTRTRLESLGYLATADTSEEATQRGILRFQKNHGELFTGGVLGHTGKAATFNAEWGPVSQKLLDVPRDCSCPDIARDEDGNEIVEARWPEDCAIELEFSYNFDRAPGLTEEQTVQGIAFALAEWNVAFDSPLNGEVYPEYLAEWQRLGEFDEVADQFVLWVGTVKHEVGHILGFNHTPGDRESVMFPAMAGQWLLNRTDLANMRGRHYSKEKPVRIEVVDWRGRNGTHIWATLGSLPGATLAWSMLSTGSCSQRGEQRYDSTVTWNKTKIDLPPLSPPEPPDTPTPEEPKVVAAFTADRAGQKFSIVTGQTGGGWEW